MIAKTTSQQQTDGSWRQASFGFIFSLARKTNWTPSNSNTSGNIGANLVTTSKHLLSPFWSCSPKFLQFDVTYGNLYILTHIRYLGDIRWCYNETMETIVSNISVYFHDLHFNHQHRSACRNKRALGNFHKKYFSAILDCSYPEWPRFMLFWVIVDFELNLEKGH